MRNSDAACCGCLAEQWSLLLSVTWPSQSACPPLAVMSESPMIQGRCAKLSGQVALGLQRSVALSLQRPVAFGSRALVAVRLQGLVVLGQLEQAMPEVV